MQRCRAKAFVRGRSHASDSSRVESLDTVMAVDQSMATQSSVLSTCDLIVDRGNTEIRWTTHYLVALKASLLIRRARLVSMLMLFYSHSLSSFLTFLILFSADGFLSCSLSPPPPFLHYFFFCSSFILIALLLLPLLPSTPFFLLSLNPKSLLSWPASYPHAHPRPRPYRRHTGLIRQLLPFRLILRLRLLSFLSRLFLTALSSRRLLSIWLFFIIFFFFFFSFSSSYF